MKSIFRVIVDIPCEYDESRKVDLIRDLAQNFNRTYNRTSKFSSNGESYSWKFPNRNALVEELKED